jgi:eukaryotic-like serine/threonine-protein kinase
MSGDFLSIATGLSMLNAETAASVECEARRTGESPETIVIRKGLLSSVQMDIIQTLRRPGDVVPGYELLGVIGHGGMGVVYRARQTTLDRIVAIKTILVSQMADPQMAMRFEKEARAVARLQHPNIISAIDFGQHDGRLFFVMELVEGEDLEILIRRNREQGRLGTATEELAWGLARQAASGLAHAAEQGIVHRDIKPANLLLVEPPAGFPLPPGMPLVKIADFGLAFLTSEAETKTRLTAANTAVGSPHYFAPEQLGGQAVDGRADIYALGATVFHLLAGQPPYAGLPLTQILTQKLTADSPRLKTLVPDFGDETDSLVADMMARQVDQRIGSYTELLQRIDDRLRATSSASLCGLPTGPMSVGSNLAHGGNLAALTMSARPLVGLTPALATTVTMQVSVSDTKPLAEARAIGDASGRSLPVDLKSPHVDQWRTRRAVIATAGVVVLGGVGYFAMRFFNGATRTPPKEQLVPTGWSQPLFDGRSLKDWQSRSGGWRDMLDEDGASVLSGTNGVVARRLFRGQGQDAQPLTHFALTLAARLHQAHAVELHFGIRPSQDGDSVRLALRVEPKTAAIVRRSADRGSPQPVTTPVPLSALTDQPRVLRLVRDATHWFAFVDSQPVGVVPLSGQPELPEFRLLAEAGAAWFSDVEVEELGWKSATGEK